MGNRLERPETGWHRRGLAVHLAVPVVAVGATVRGRLHHDDVGNLAETLLHPSRVKVLECNVEPVDRCGGRWGHSGTHCRNLTKRIGT